MSWQIPRTKIVDYIGLAALSRPFTVGQKVFSLFRDSDDDDEEQTTEFYTAEVVRVLKTGVAVRFEDGDTNISKYTDIFRADDVYGATQ
ncbi:hypothetical protein BC831DRAFT_449059 [Entophlyctis helioformis]|nr:hypothetical protein BC831DRAFT_449059 [Entophlyctis helioformis]